MVIEHIDQLLRRVQRGTLLGQKEPRIYWDIYQITYPNSPTPKVSYLIWDGRRNNGYRPTVKADWRPGTCPSDHPVGYADL